MTDYLSPAMACGTIADGWRSKTGQLVVSDRLEPHLILFDITGEAGPLYRQGNLAGGFVKIAELVMDDAQAIEQPAVLRH